MGSDSNAQQFTQILERILDGLNGTACQVVHTVDEGLDVKNDLHEASLTACRAVEPLCGDDLESLLDIKDMIKFAVEGLQVGRQLDRKGVKPEKFSDEEIQRVRDEFHQVSARFDEIELGKNDKQIDYKK